MTRMTGPDCVVMCNLINTHTHTCYFKKNLNASKPPEHPPVFSRQSFSSDSMGSDSGITSREGWCTTDAVSGKEMSVL